MINRVQTLKVFLNHLVIYPHVFPQDSSPGPRIILVPSRHLGHDIPAKTPSSPNHQKSCSGSAASSTAEVSKPNIQSTAPIEGQSAVNFVCVHMSAHLEIGGGDGDFWGTRLKNVWRDVKTYDAEQINLADAPRDPTSNFHKIVIADGIKLRCHDVRNALTSLHVYQEIEDLRKLARARLERHFPTLHSLVLDEDSRITGVLMTFEWKTRKLKEVAGVPMGRGFKEALRAGVSQLARLAHEAGYKWAPRPDDIHYYTTPHGDPMVFVTEIGHEGGRVAGNPDEEGSSTTSPGIANLEKIFYIIDSFMTDDTASHRSISPEEGRKRLLT